ncbi:5-formyltetrahydrofolate cyclo-ligase [Clostridium gasigenes]|uniref:5-formyltetrahydrofolate cyclo-ligase n=1 Tax=Clostridium gasigenes TaxID=94869 RepID=A0A7X0VT86_9CLOT|nr:5-formyltetrahydrofolate cyclo-ligase [Clostridium gasigenes]MBB6715336.1 5-formyltetrahydrofolate cyclo-ligase [Clostridium gasigenes]
MEKKEFRNMIIKNRDSLSLVERNLNDNLILETLLKSKMYKESTNIFTFINYGSEVKTKIFIIKALEDGKRIFVPKTVSGTREMKAVEISSLDNLKPDNWGILEPKTFKGEIDKQCLDLIIVPGVAFDKDGNRIGYGGGYYDRYFSGLNSRIKKVVLAYDLQIVESLVTEKHDVTIDFIITEKEITEIK